MECQVYIWYTYVGKRLPLDFAILNAYMGWGFPPKILKLTSDSTLLALFSYPAALCVNINEQKQGYIFVCLDITSWFSPQATTDFSFVVAVSANMEDIKTDWKWLQEILIPTLGTYIYQYEYTVLIAVLFC